MCLFYPVTWIEAYKMSHGAEKDRELLFRGTKQVAFRAGRMTTEYEWY